MLTEDQLAAVIDGVKGVGRFVLVGDPRQLPPIGAGRPFVDIVSRLRPDELDTKFPRRAPGCGELTVPRRPTQLDGVETHQAERRADLMLAEWFGGRDPSPGADVIWDQLRSKKVDETLQVIRWEGPADLREKLLDVLVEDLGLASAEDTVGFERPCGGSEWAGNMFFWRARSDDRGAAAEIEKWQILSPVRAHAHGVRDLNRFLQRQLRSSTIERAKERSFYRKIPRPLGPDEIVYGDKVISIVNESWREVFPAGGGTAIHRLRRHRRRCRPVQAQGDEGPPVERSVEFAEQDGFVYDYRPADFGDEGSPPLELAYALTVHKAQGSEFGRTIVVIPNPCRILSRELLYTALTRQKEHVTLLYQGDPAELKRFAEPDRLGNRDEAHEPLCRARPGRDLARDLPRERPHPHHHPGRRRAVEIRGAHRRAAQARNIEYAYERRLAFDDGSFRYPDFTIEDDDLGRIDLLEAPRDAQRLGVRQTLASQAQVVADRGVVEPRIG